jgi:hypothetical protein
MGRSYLARLFALIHILLGLSSFTIARSAAEEGPESPPDPTGPPHLAVDIGPQDEMGTRGEALPSGIIFTVPGPALAVEITGAEIPEPTLPWHRRPRPVSGHDQ